MKALLMERGVIEMVHQKKASRKYGLSPGALVYTGKKDAEEPVVITLINYNADKYTEKKGISLEECEAYIDPDSMTWINISGIHKPEIIEQLGKMFHLHPLLLEDVLNTGGRPKMDDYEEYLFLVLKMIDYRADVESLDHEHVCLVMRKGVVISLQEREGDVFGPVRDRLKKAKSNIRKSGSDYLTYTLIDMIVDHYFWVLENLGEKIEDFQDMVLTAPDPSVLESIHNLKRQVIYIRKSVWPVREIAGTLLRGDSDLIGREIQVYLRDVYDHTIQVVETVEMFRDVLASVLDIYLSSINNKMNEVMKVLTVIATIFIPLTFIAGVYGMNFTFMPELEYRYAYPLVWMVFIIAGGGMMAWFKYRKWF
jgi:magnesium transporter